MGSCAKDVHRRSLVDFLTIRRRARLFNKRFERESVGVEDPGRVRNDEGTAALVTVLVCG